MRGGVIHASEHACERAGIALDVRAHPRVEPCGVDAVARLFADKMATILGQTVVVENRGGAAGLIAGRAAANADPDGYTFAYSPGSAMMRSPRLA